ncbi:MAG: SapC family protein [Steroidobacter sp.]
MMATPLDPIRHRQTLVGAFPDYAHARQQQHAILGFGEIALAAADYPLALMKHADTGRVNIVALYGLSTSSKLYIAGARWHATYSPQNSLRYPFFSNDAGTLGLAIDERSELIGVSDGHRVFDDAGIPTQYTRQIANTLRELRRDFEAMQELVSALTRLHLVKPMSVVLHTGDGSESRLEGLYSVSDQALSALADADVVKLHRKGYLQAVSVVMASLVQINRLQQLHNAQSGPQIRDVELLLRER